MFLKVLVLIYGFLLYFTSLLMHDSFNFYIACRSGMCVCGGGGGEGGGGPSSQIRGCLSKSTYYSKLKLCDFPYFSISRLPSERISAQ